MRSLKVRNQIESTLSLRMIRLGMNSWGRAGSEKIFLKAGESKTVSFDIDEPLLRFYNYDLEHVAETGEFDVMIGGSSQQVKTARFTLK